MVFFLGGRHARNAVRCAAYVTRGSARSTYATAGSPSPARPPRLPRIYRYWIDVHGQLFLYDTVPKNLTSCFKSVPFLNFFSARVERIPHWTGGCSGTPVPEHSDSIHWTEDTAALQALRDDTAADPWHAVWRRLHDEGIGWWSNCQGEWNVIHAVDTPIVFRGLNERDELVWGGDHLMQIDPAALLVHPVSGYLYHPSPMSPLHSRRRANQSPYGAYSLIASSVVLQHFADGLDIDLGSPGRLPDGRACGGSVQWRGTAYPLGILQPGNEL
ncbi:hypothetical protein MSPP1_001197 [Malassezia sp. CBS 17886]|nr:hypothetical protein MSPP1_001197 [Malassezia sp. CBS 17886]